MSEGMRTGVLHESLLPPYKRGNGTGVNVPVVAIDDVVRWLRGEAIKNRQKEDEILQWDGDPDDIPLLRQRAIALEGAAEHFESLKGTTSED